MENPITSRRKQKDLLEWILRMVIHNRETRKICNSRLGLMAFDQDRGKVHYNGPQTHATVEAPIRSG